MDIAVNNYSELVSFALEKGVTLVIPGPEIPLVEGIEGHFRKGRVNCPKGIVMLNISVGIGCFGPSKKAARMEGSKVFSKNFMIRNNIPTARAEAFIEFEEARNYVESIDYDIVIKASGLAAGKGVIIPASKEEAVVALRQFMLDKSLGDAADEVLIEEFLEGEEISVLAFSDGYTIVPLPAAQDHKRIFDGDQGPNTGGMGCYAPAPVATPNIMRQIQNETLQPTIDAMRREGYPFVGILFVGFMLTRDGPRVLEYNVRFGDPEAQSLLPLLETDLAKIIIACVEHRLDSFEIAVKPDSAVTVVMSAEGYPGSYAKGTPITLKPEPPGVLYFMPVRPNSAPG